MRRRNPHKSSDPRAEAEAAVTEVRAIYADLEAKAPERNCTFKTECCRFRLTGRTPMLTLGEAFTAAKALRASGRRELPKAPSASADGACPLLHPATGKCMIYAGRPFGCRTHFCEQAGGPYARRDVADLIRRLDDIDERLGGEGTREIGAAIRDALEELR